MAREPDAKSRGQLLVSAYSPWCPHKPGVEFHFERSRPVGLQLSQVADGELLSEGRTSMGAELWVRLYALALWRQRQVVGPSGFLEGLRLHLRQSVHSLESATAPADQ